MQEVILCQALSGKGWALCRAYSLVSGKNQVREIFPYSGQGRRWLKTLELKEKSDEFIMEYCDLGHMEEVARMLREDTNGDVY